MFTAPSQAGPDSPSLFRNGTRVTEGPADRIRHLFLDYLLNTGKLFLDNLVVILDNNGCQVDGFTRNICNIEPVHDKWMGFGWHVQRVPGHDLERIIEDIEYARVILGKPHIIIADTIKGKGISFMENKPEWHAQALSEAQYQQACRDLQAIYDQLAGEVIR